LDPRLRVAILPETFLIALLLLLALAILLKARLVVPVLLGLLLLLLAESLLISLSLLALLTLAILLLAIACSLFGALLLRLLLPGPLIFGLGFPLRLGLILLLVLLFAPVLPLALLIALWVAEGWGTQEQEQNCRARESSLYFHGLPPHDLMVLLPQLFGCRKTKRRGLACKALKTKVLAVVSRKA
jgi:hypothetical protein